MNRLSLAELERRCQKPDHRRIGNWMARRVARPAALRITWLIAPYGVTAHATTLLAWAVGLTAAAQFALGTPVAWLCGALTLQLWYLLDHVDGQLARLRGTASLDGVQLDYLMHHTLNLLVPLSLGYGVAQWRGSDFWLACGLTWGLAALTVGLIADARYKAFIQRLKRVQGELRVLGGGGAKPSEQPDIPRAPLKFMSWALQKACEPHVVMNAVTGLAFFTWCIPSLFAATVATYVSVMALANLAVNVVRLSRAVLQQDAEAEFARWFRPAAGEDLLFRDGWWYVEHRDMK